MTEFKRVSVTVTLVKTIVPRLVTIPLKVTVWPISMNCGLQPLVTPIKGGAISITFTIWLQVFDTLQPSIAAQMRVAENEFPQSGLVAVFTTTMRFVPQEPGAVVGGSKVHAAPRATVRFVAQVMEGGVVSLRHV